VVDESFLVRLEAWAEPSSGVTRNGEELDDDAIADEAADVPTASTEKPSP
jgi:hypothetical protein